MIATLVKPIQYPSHYRRPHRRNLRYHVRSCFPYLPRPRSTLSQIFAIPFNVTTRCVSSRTASAAFIRAYFKTMTFSRMFKLKVLPRVNIWRATGWRIKILEITFLYVHGLTLKRAPVLATPCPFLPCCIYLELEPLCWRKTNQHRASRRRYELNVDRKGCKSLNSTLLIYLKLQWKIIQHILYLNTREINRGTRMEIDWL